LLNRRGLLTSSAAVIAAGVGYEVLSPSKLPVPFFHSIPGLDGQTNLVPQPKVTLIRDGFGVSGLAWSPDGNHISAIVGGNSESGILYVDDSPIKIVTFDVSGKKVATFPCNADLNSCVIYYMSDNNLLIESADAISPVVYNPVTGDIKTTIKLPSLVVKNHINTFFSCICTSLNSKKMLVSFGIIPDAYNNMAQFYLYSTDTYEIIQSYNLSNSTGYHFYYSNLAMANDAKYAVLASFNGEILYYDLIKNEVIRKIDWFGPNGGHVDVSIPNYSSASLGSLDFDSTNTYLAASAHHMNNYSGPSVGIFNVENGSLVIGFDDPISPKIVRWNKAGNLIGVSSEDGPIASNASSVIIYAPFNSDTSGIKTDPIRGLRDLRWSPTKNILAANSDDGIYLFDFT
jgi:hypothetical protein